MGSRSSERRGCVRENAELDLKSEIRSSKSEVNPNDETTNDRNGRDSVRRHPFSVYLIGAFEIVSDFGFRASDFGSMTRAVMREDLPGLLLSSRSSARRVELSVIDSQAVEPLEVTFQPAAEFVEVTVLWR